MQRGERFSEVSTSILSRRPQIPQGSHIYFGRWSGDEIKDTYVCQGWSLDSMGELERWQLRYEVLHIWKLFKTPKDTTTVSPLQPPQRSGGWK